jgi:hypothetical protein
MRHLFQRVCHSIAPEQTTGAFCVGFCQMAIEGTVDKVADTSANVLSFGCMRSGTHQSPFPSVHCVSLAEGGTPAIVETVVGAGEHLLVPWCSPAQCNWTRLS